MSTYQLRGGALGDECSDTGRRWTFVLADGGQTVILTGRMCGSRDQALRNLKAVRAWPGTSVHLARHATQGAGKAEGRHFFTLGEAGFPTLATSNYYGTKDALELAILRFATQSRDATMLDDVPTPSSARETPPASASPKPRAHLRPGSPRCATPALSAPAGWESAEYRVESTRGEHRAALRDHSRTLLATIPNPLREAAVRAVSAIRQNVGTFARYTGHASADGWHFFRLHDAWGKLLAISGFFKTARSRNKAFGACISLGPAAPFLEEKPKTINVVTRRIRLPDAAEAAEETQPPSVT